MSLLRVRVEALRTRFVVTCLISRFSTALSVPEGDSAAGEHTGICPSMHQLLSDPVYFAGL